MKLPIKGVTALLFMLFPLYGYTQDVVPVVSNITCDYGGTKIMPSETAKALRTSSARSGNITINGCADMPDSLKVALQIASDVWSCYMPIGTSLDLDVVYEDVQDADIKTEVSYLASTNSSSETTYYPLCLYRKIFGETQTDSPDAVIHINKNTNWSVGIGNGISPTSKNLSYALLTAVAKAMGFGASVLYDETKDNIVFPFPNGMSAFDKLIFSEDGIHMSDLDNSRPNELKDFVQQDCNYLYAAQNDARYRLYAPKQFDENKSLKYLSDPNRLMYYKDEGVKDLFIDEVTLDLLNTIGWSKPDNNIKTAGEGINDTGIASAYQSHTFSIQTDNTEITEHQWEYKLPLATGGYETVATSSDAEFTTSAITDEEKYKHTIDGDIRGLITFTGKSNGENVTGTYCLTSELKPHILSANIISITKNPKSPDYYDIVVEVHYEGGNYLHSTIEEEHSSIVNTVFSNTPYYTRLTFTDVDLYGSAQVTITARNDYGSDTAVLEIPSITSSIDNVLPDIDASTDYSSIKVFTPSGLYLGNAESINQIGKFDKGLLILKMQGKSGRIKTIKYINK